MNQDVSYDSKEAGKQSEGNGNKEGREEIEGKEESRGERKDTAFAKRLRNLAENLIIGSGQHRRCLCQQLVF